MLFATRFLSATLKRAALLTERSMMPHNKRSSKLECTVIIFALGLVELLVVPSSLRGLGKLNIEADVVGSLLGFSLPG
jgi:hypothetical protein